MQKQVLKNHCQATAVKTYLPQLCNFARIVSLKKERKGKPLSFWKRKIPFLQYPWVFGGAVAYVDPYGGMTGIFEEQYVSGVCKVLCLGYDLI